MGGKNSKPKQNKLAKDELSEVDLERDDKDDHDDRSNRVSTELRNKPLAKGRLNGFSLNALALKIGNGFLWVITIVIFTPLSIAKGFAKGFYYSTIRPLARKFFSPFKAALFRKTLNSNEELAPFRAKDNKSWTRAELTTLKEKFADTYRVFRGEFTWDNGHQMHRYGLLDVFTLGLLIYTKHLADEYGNIYKHPLLFNLLAIPFAILNIVLNGIVRELFAVVATIAFSPIVVLAHGISQLVHIARRNREVTKFDATTPLENVAAPAESVKPKEGQQAEVKPVAPAQSSSTRNLLANALKEEKISLADVSIEENLRHFELVAHKKQPGAKTYFFKIDLKHPGANRLKEAVLGASRFERERRKLDMKGCA